MAAVNNSINQLYSNNQVGICYYRLLQTLLVEQLINNVAADIIMIDYLYRYIILAGIK